MKTYLLEKEKERCLDEINEKEKIIYREKQKFIGKEEFKEKLD